MYSNNVLAWIMFSSCIYILYTHALSGAGALTLLLNTRQTVLRGVRARIGRSFYTIPLHTRLTLRAFVYIHIGLLCCRMHIIEWMMIIIFTIICIQCARKIYYFIYHYKHTTTWLYSILCNVAAPYPRRIWNESFETI